MFLTGDCAFRIRQRADSSFYVLVPSLPHCWQKMRLAAERAAEVRRQDELEGVLPASAAPAASQGEAPKEKGLDLASYDAHDHSAHDALPGEDMPSRSRGADQSASSPKSPSRGKKRKREENSDSEEAFSKPSKKQCAVLSLSFFHSLWIESIRKHDDRIPAGCSCSFSGWDSFRPWISTSILSLVDIERV